MKIIILSFLGIYLSTFSCCNNRNPQYNFAISFSDTISAPFYNYYKSIYMPGSIKNIETGLFSNSFVLPINYNSDITTYIFISDYKSDTLTLKYTRDYLFLSNECGFELLVSDYKIIQPTTFKNIVINENSASVSRY